MKKKNGFAISGILYPLLILTLFLVVQILMMMQTRKNVLDKARMELSDTINASNKVYTNEELSILLDKYKSDMDKNVESIKADYEDKLAKMKTDYETKINNLRDEKHVPSEKTFHLMKRITTSNASTTQIQITNADGPIYLEMKIYGQFGYIDYGGYVDYKLGSFNTSNRLYGVGTSIDKQGEISKLISSITPSYSDSNKTLTLKINCNNFTHANGSNVYFEIRLYRGDGILPNTTATIN